MAELLDLASLSSGEAAPTQLPIFVADFLVPK